MDLQLIRRLIGAKLKDPSTYWLSAFVGTLIVGYGQFLVPWFRDVADPLANFAQEFRARPAVSVFSVFLGYAFPFCVSVYSSVVTAYKSRS